MAWLATPVQDLEDPNYYVCSETHTRHIEAACLGGLDSVLMLQKAVRDFETKLHIHHTWTPNSCEWKDTEHYLNIHMYQCALDNLEGLVVARLFELTKMNQSQTGLYFTATHA